MRHKVIIAALCILSFGICVSSYKIFNEYHRLTERFVPNLWVAAQAEIELLRFLNQLSAHADGRIGDDDDLTKRLYILWSRMPLLLHGAESNHVRAVDGAVATINELDATLERYEPTILSLERNDSATYRQLHGAFRKFLVPIHQIVAKTMLKDEETAAAHRAEIRRIFWTVSWSFVGIIAGAILLLIVLIHSLQNVSRLLHKANAASASASAAETQLKAVIDAVPARVNARDATGEYVFRNRYDIERDGASFLAGECDADTARLAALDRHVLQTGMAIPIFEETTTGEHGHATWLITKVPVRDARGRPMQVVTVALDITAQKDAQTRNALLAMAVEHAGDAIEITDAEGRFEYVNSAFEHISGYARGDAIGQTPQALLMGDSNDEPYYQTAQDVIESGQRWHGILTARRKDGSVLHQETTISPVRDTDGRITHFVAVKRDITGRLEAEAKIWHLAHHDPLTGLPNRVRFQERLRETLAQARRAGSMVAIHFLDLDGFKNVNDTLGHAAGDELLKAVTMRIREMIRETDTIARLGGDEFAVIQSGISSGVAAGNLAQRLLGRLAEPYSIESQDLHISACIGITLYPLHDEDPDQLLKNADMAMYRSKLTGRANYQFFQQEMKEVCERRKILESDLRKAMAAGQLELCYQPIVDARTSDLIAVEALVRWTHPERGPIPPADFIPVAEDGGLIVELGEWVLRTACRQNRTWQDLSLPEVRIAVNLSAVQFLHRGLVAGVLEALETSGLDPRHLELEITEGVLMRDTEGTVSMLEQLADRGIRIALDDFGTGYSSMGYLKRFPVNKIKIDRTFITEVVADRGDAAIVKAVVSLARGLGLTVTAEGVENSEQAARLRAIGCTELQGYFFGRPMTACELEHRLREQSCKSTRAPRTAGGRKAKARHGSDSDTAMVAEL